MIRQYRIDRFNGLEVLVCEVYRRHTWTQSEYDAWQTWKGEKDAAEATQAEFAVLLSEWLHEDHGPQDTFYGLRDLIPGYDYLPAIVLRGIVVDNRVASLQVDYNAAVLPPEIVDAVQKFYGVLDSRHWRDMVAHQIEMYGTLLEAPDD